MVMRNLIRFFAAFALPVLVSAGVVAVTPVPPEGALMPASQFLPEKPGFTSWRVLAQVSSTSRGSK